MYYKSAQKEPERLTRFLWLIEPAKTTQAKQMFLKLVI